jgi:Protein of unknown function (DUF2628)
MLCPFCSEEIADTAIKCKHCNEILNKVAHDRLRDAQSSATANELMPSLSTYEQQAFQKILANGERRTEFKNWAAFLFGPFWYCYKGMWLRGSVALIASIASGGFLVFPFAVYAAWFGDYDHYQFKVKGRQIWFI